MPPTPTTKAAARSERTARESSSASADYRERLVDALPADRCDMDRTSTACRELTYQLLDFHRRADKPQWWAHVRRAWRLTKAS